MPAESHEVTLRLFSREDGVHQSYEQCLPDPGEIEVGTMLTRALGALPLAVCPHRSVANALLNLLGDAKDDKGKRLKMALYAYLGAPAGSWKATVSVEVEARKGEQRAGQDEASGPPPVPAPGPGDAGPAT